MMCRERGDAGRRVAGLRLWRAALAVLCGLGLAQPASALELIPDARLPPVAVTAAAGDACVAAAPTDATLRQLARDALRLSPGVRRSQAEWDRAEARLDQAWSSLGPALRARFSYGQDDYRNISRPQGSTESQRQWLVSLTQPLFDGMSGYSRIQQGRAQREAVEFGGTDQRARAVGAALRNYLLVQRQRELLMLAEENLRRHQDYGMRIDALVRGKAGRVTERDLSQSRVSMALQQVTEAQAAVADAEALFRLQLGREPGAQLPALSAACWLLPRDLDQAMTSAVDGNPALAALRRQRVASDRAVDVARALRYPTVSLELTASDRQDLDGVDNGFRDERSSRVLVAVDYSFRSGAEEARIREAKAERGVADADLEAETRRIESEAASAYVKMSEMQRQQAQLEDRARYSTAARRGYEEQFSVGMRSLIDLLSATADETQALSARVGGGYELLQAQLSLLQTQGRLLAVLGLDDEALLATVPDEAAP